MVLGTIIFAGVAGVMLGWNIHVMRKNGVCCPPPRADGTPESSSRAVSESPHLRRRRHRSSSSRNRAHKDKEADLRRRAKKAGVGGGGGGGGSGSTKVMMDAVQEQQEEAQQAPAFGMSTEATGRVNGGEEGAPPGQ
ncbi:unnamed protein product [Ectocarpus sp. CCAP 1310/34]|nr:unnamed protein product [Ectocarpus sp. CCAP 1310/34]